MAGFFGNFLKWGVWGVRGVSKNPPIEQSLKNSSNTHRIQSRKKPIDLKSFKSITNNATETMLKPFFVILFHDNHWQIFCFFHGPMCQNCRIRCMEKCRECRSNLNRSTPLKKNFLNYVKKWLPNKITSWKLRHFVFIRFNKFRTFFYGFMYFGAKLWVADTPPPETAWNDNWNVTPTDK